MRPAWVASFISVTQADLSTTRVSLEGELEVTSHAAFYHQCRHQREKGCSPANAVY